MHGLDELRNEIKASRLELDEKQEDELRQAGWHRWVFYGEITSDEDRTLDVLIFVTHENSESYWVPIDPNHLREIAARLRSRATMDQMRSLDRKQINTVEVIKGRAAMSVYGAEAKDGVIVITTRRGGSIG